MKAALGRVANIKSFPSTGIARIEVEIPIESYTAAVPLLYGQDVLVTVAPPSIKKTLGVYGIHDSGDDPDEPQVEKPKEPAAKDQGIVGVAGALCKNPEFWRFLSQTRKACTNEQQAAEIVRAHCQVSSRGDLANDEAAAARFHTLRKEWLKWRDGT